MSGYCTTLDDCGCDRPLNDYLFQPVVIGFFGSEFQNHVLRVNNIANSGAGLACYPVKVGKNCYTYDEAKTVIVSYINSVKQGLIPEYDRVNNIGKIETIEQYVAKVSGYPLARVKAVLLALWEGVHSGKVPNDMLLRPLTRRADAKLRETPEEFENEEPTSLEKWAKILVISGAILVPAYFLTKITSNVKEITD